MVRIIKGTFGLYDGRKVVPITFKNGPISLDTALEQRLVDKGVAEYAEASGSAAEASAPPAFDADMKIEKLREIALVYGVNTAGIRKKADIVAAIEAAVTSANKEEDDEDDEEEQAEEDNDEQPPVLGASDPV